MASPWVFGATCDERAEVCRTQRDAPQWSIPVSRYGRLC